MKQTRSLSELAICPNIPDFTLSAVNLPANMLASNDSSPDCTIRDIIENDLNKIKVKAFLQVISEKIRIFSEREALTKISKKRVIKLDMASCIHVYGIEKKPQTSAQSYRFLRNSVDIGISATAIADKTTKTCLEVNNVTTTAYHTLIRSS